MYQNSNKNKKHWNKNINYGSLLNRILIIICYLNISSIKCEKHPHIVTKGMNITAYEGRTVVLPCIVKNLNSDHYVIWQYGLSKNNQTFLTIGNQLVEPNYRLRVVTNVDEINYGSDESVSESVKAASDSETYEIGKPLAYNLEVRKLQFDDAGWYECQLNTKPTIKNYIHLKVLNEPKIHQLPEKINKDEPVELICEVNNPNNAISQINWYKDGKLLNNDKHVKHLNQNHSESHFYKIHTHSTPNGKLVSKLVIKKTRSDHNTNGVYKCKCDDGSEARYMLGIEHNGRMLDDRALLTSTAAAITTIMKNSEFFLLIFLFNILVI